MNKYKDILCSSTVIHCCIQSSNFWLGQYVHHLPIASLGCVASFDCYYNKYYHVDVFKKIILKYQIFSSKYLKF